MATTTQNTTQILGHRIGNSSCVIFDGLDLKVGSDFTDAVTGTPQSHGEIKLRRLLTTQEISHKWISTLPVVATELILRKAAESEGFKVTFFMSQGVVLDTHPRTLL